MHSNDGQQQGGSMVLYDLCTLDPRPSADMLSDRLWAVADRLLNTPHLFDHLATFQGAFIAALRECAELKTPPYRLLPLLADVEAAVPSHHPMRVHILQMIGSQRAQLWRGILTALNDHQLSLWLHHEQEQVPALAETFSSPGVASPEEQDQCLQDYLYQNSFLELLLSKTFRCLIVGAKANLAPEEYLQICQRIDEVLKDQWRDMALGIDPGYQSLPSYQTTLNKVVGLLQILHVEIGQSAEQADWYVSQESVENWLAGVSQEVAELYPPKAAVGIPSTPEPEPEVEAPTQDSMWDWVVGSAGYVGEGLSQVASAVSQALTASSQHGPRRNTRSPGLLRAATTIGALMVVAEIPVASGYGILREYQFENITIHGGWRYGENALHGSIFQKEIPDDPGYFYNRDRFEPRSKGGAPFPTGIFYDLSNSDSLASELIWQPEISHRGPYKFESAWIVYRCEGKVKPTNECERLGADLAQVDLFIENHIPTPVKGSDGNYTQARNLYTGVGAFRHTILCAEDEDRKPASTSMDVLTFTLDRSAVPNAEQWLFSEVNRNPEGAYCVDIFGTVPPNAPYTYTVSLTVTDPYIGTVATELGVQEGRFETDFELIIDNKAPDSPIVPSDEIVLAGDELRTGAPPPKDDDGQDTVLNFKPYSFNGQLVSESGDLPTSFTYNTELQTVIWPTSSSQRGTHCFILEGQDVGLLHPEVSKLSYGVRPWCVTVDNNPPEVALTLAPLSGHANGRVWLQPAPGVIVDADGDLDPLTYSIVRLDGLPLPDGFYVNPNSGVGYWDVPIGTEKQTWGLALRGCDAYGDCADAPWYVTIEPRAAELATAEQLRLVTNGVGQSYVSPPLASRYREPDGDGFSLVVSGLPQGLSFNGSHVLGTPEQFTVGPTGIGVRVTDTDGLVFQETGEVFNPNSPPAIEVIGNHTSGVEQTHLQVSATDPDGKSSTLTYSLTNNPDFVRISSTSGRITFNPPRGEDVQGAYPDIEVIVTDEDHSRYGNGQSTMRFTYVIENGEIRLVPGVDTTIPVNCQTNRLVDVREFYEEPDGDEVTEAYITEQSLDDPNDPPVVRSGSTLSISPLSEHQGRNYTVRVALSDGHGSTQVLRLAFPIPNRGPVRKKELGLSFTDSSASQLPYGDAIEDPDGGVISYVVEEVPESCEDEQASLQLVCEAGSTETARYTAYLIGCDLGGECRREPIELTANPVVVRDTLIPTVLGILVTLLGTFGVSARVAARRSRQQKLVTAEIKRQLSSLRGLHSVSNIADQEDFAALSPEAVTDEVLSAVFTRLARGMLRINEDATPLPQGDAEVKDLVGRCQVTHLQAWVQLGGEPGQAVDPDVKRLLVQFNSDKELAPERVEYLVEKLSALAEKLATAIAERVNYMAENSVLATVLDLVKAYEFVAEQWKRLRALQADKQGADLIYNALGCHGILLSLVRGLHNEFGVKPSHKGRVLIRSVVLLRLSSLIYRHDVLSLDDASKESFELDWQIRMRMLIKLQPSVAAMLEQGFLQAFFVAKLAMNLLLVFPDNVDLNAMWLINLVWQRFFHSTQQIAREKQAYMNMIPRDWLPYGYTNYLLLSRLVNQRAQVAHLDHLIHILDVTLPAATLSSFTHPHYWALQGLIWVLGQSNLALKGKAFAYLERFPWSPGHNLSIQKCLHKQLLRAVCQYIKGDDADELHIKKSQAERYSAFLQGCIYQPFFGLPEQVELFGLIQDALAGSPRGGVAMMTKMNMQTHYMRTMNGDGRSSGPAVDEEQGFLFYNPLGHGAAASTPGGPESTHAAGALLGGSDVEIS